MEDILMQELIRQHRIKAERKFGQCRWKGKILPRIIQKSDIGIASEKKGNTKKGNRYKNNGIDPDVEKHRIPGAENFIF